MIVYKVHHSLADGIATILMLINVTDSPVVTDIPPLMIRYPLYVQVVIGLLSPLIMLYHARFPSGLSEKSAWLKQTDNLMGKLTS